MSRRNKNRPAGSAQPNTLTLDAFSNPLFRLGYGSIADDLIPEGVARIDRLARAMAQQATKPAA